MLVAASVNAAIIDGMITNGTLFSVIGSTPDRTRTSITAPSIVPDTATMNGPQLGGPPPVGNVGVRPVA